MKLSMWMIANRLQSLDMKLDIRGNAPVILNSARRVYATNCVHVYAENNDVICNGEGDSIRFEDTDLTLGFEIVASVFDYFQDWMDRLIRLTRERDYQGVVDLAYEVFKNPIVLLDGNNRVLGMTREYSPDSLDEEWEYLCKYGYSSLNAVQQMRYDYNTFDYWYHGPKRFNFSGSNFLGYEGLTYCMYCNDSICGRINVLAKDRELNTGDSQLLEQVAMMLEPMLGQIYYESVLNNTNVFYNILFGNPYDQKQLDTQLCYQQWHADDNYYLTIVEVTGRDHHPASDSAVEQLLHVLARQATGCMVMKKQPYILLLGTKNLSTEPSMTPIFNMLTGHNPIRIAFSLPAHGIKQTAFLYEQALYALNEGKRCHPESRFYDFFDYAIDYILESGALLSSVQACMPAVLELYERHQQNGDELFRTLQIYLENERSISRTSEALYTHRNTVLYRIRKIQDLFDHDLSDSYTREYTLLSIKILYLYHRKTNDHYCKT